MDSAQTLIDARWVRKVRMGNADAFGKLYLKYIDPIYRFVYYKVGQDKDIAEDLTETVFFKAWKSLTFRIAPIEGMRIASSKFSTALKRELHSRREHPLATLSIMVIRLNFGLMVLCTYY